MDKELKDLVFGKHDLDRVVGSEVHDGSIDLYIQNLDGSIDTVTKPFKYWIVAPKQLSDKWQRLEGDLNYKYIRYLDTQDEFIKMRNNLRGRDHYLVNNFKEQAMTQYGFTYFKNINLSEISVLAFDIETTGLYHNDDSKVVLISNTFRQGDRKEKKLFCIDEYSTQGEMIDDWCNWVRSLNPSILTGHNIYSFDLPYLNYVAQQEGTALYLGRNDSPAHFNNYQSKFRKDQTQHYLYNECKIYGREIVDTLFLSIKYDYSRKYESYGLKNIIKHEKLEKPGRTFYDASKIRTDYLDPVKFNLIKEYCIDDADDALALFDLMIPAQFYFNRSVPKPLQMIINSATGSPINSILVRSYLQHKHSIPKPDEKVEYEGAISFGAAGVYKNCWKIDVASLYPSIVLAYEIWDRKKDPKGHFYKMVEYFTNERLNNKKLAEETGDKNYKDLSEAQKIVVNSAYGLLGSTGLPFNSPANAKLITEKGRDILKHSIKWATGNDYELTQEINSESEI